ncbi:MAG TPA: hypothetical protein PK395_06395 [bacterium]|nr:hypothetical protein [bacterium]
MMPNEINNHSEREVGWWEPVLFAAMAGGMGWGIRGQYGHETGAMIAGLLVTLVLTHVFCKGAPALWTARAAAIGTVGICFGGSMTYGQTVGLTHDPGLVGNWAAFRWGMLGLSIKGAVWIGLAGVFFGMGLGGIRYRFRDMLLLMFAMLGAYHIGIDILNSPFYPDRRILPPIYFSGDWYWQPDKADLLPRRECWGGLWFALLAAIAYVHWFHKDRLARNLALWGILGGAIGFPFGQSLQAYHVWNVESFKTGFWAVLDPHMNWWNWMETTFGATMGGILGLGLWLNRKRIQPYADADKEVIPSGMEWTLFVVHVAFLVGAEFLEFRLLGRLYGFGLVMGIIPMAAIVGGRWWPYFLVLPVTLVPIAGKTIKELVYEKPAIDPTLGWIVYLIIPLLIALAVSIWFAQKGMAGQIGRDFTRRVLLLNTWMYFFLNFAFFHYPWPWAEWTGRTPNGIMFTICAIGLTVAALRGRSARSVQE